MTLSELIAQFRSDADDRVANPYLFSTADIRAWLNEAQEEAADRALLLHDSTTAEICTIDVVANTATYALDGRIINLKRVAYTADGSTDEVVLICRDRTEQDRWRPNWRREVDVPREYIHDSTSLTLGCLPASDGTLALEVDRLPLTNIEDSASEEPEIHRLNHRELVHWALYRGYSRPDSEVHDPQRAAIELERFERTFGLSRSAKRRRDLNANVPLVNKAIW